MSILHKSSPVYKQDLTVENGVINGVVIIQEGKDKAGDYFDRNFLDNIVRQGNSYPQGIKSRFGHPNMCKDSLGSYLGRYKDFRIQTTADGSVVKADLFLDPISKTSPDGDLYTYVMNMSQTNPDMFGNSIVFAGESDEIEMNGERVMQMSLVSFMASDLVDSPCATDSLFKSSNDLGIVMTQFLDENPNVMDVIANNPSIISDFIEKRYIPYLTKKSKQLDMNILKSVQKAFGVKAKNIDLTLEDGSLVTVITDAETPAVGDQVVIGDTPVADATHVLGDGSSIVTVDGVITEIIPAQETEPETPATPTEDVMESIETLEKSVDTIGKKIAELTKSITAIQSMQKEQSDAILFISKSVGSTFVIGVGDPAKDAPRIKRTLGNNFTKK